MKAAVVAAAAVVVLLGMAEAASAKCEQRYTFADHAEWSGSLFRAESIPKWASERHREHVTCSASRNHGQAMRVRWRKIKRSLLPANHDLWVRIGRCEQPGSGYRGVNWSHPGPTFQGGLGFWYGTWDGYKPSGFPADAGQATWRQQMIVANRVAAAVGFTAWGCY